MDILFIQQINKDLLLFHCHCHNDFKLQCITTYPHCTYAYFCFQINVIYVLLRINKLWIGLAYHYVNSNKYIICINGNDLPRIGFEIFMNEKDVRKDHKRSFFWISSLLMDYDFFFICAWPCSYTQNSFWNNVYIHFQLTSYVRTCIHR